jgi:8-oxo-dGTP pyrophosphatase MutT (NUDIX family)
LNSADVAEVTRLARRRAVALLGGPRTHGVICVVRNDRHELLIVKPRYRGWGIVAGFCDPDEDPELAAARELVEEAGVRLDRPPVLLGRRARRAHDDHIMFVQLDHSPVLAPTSWEIASAIWSPVAALPPLHKTSFWALQLAGVELTGDNAAASARLLPGGSFPVTGREGSVVKDPS